MRVKRILGFQNKDPYSVTIVFFARKRCSCAYTRSALIYTVFGIQYFERNPKSKKDYWSAATASKSEIFVKNLQAAIGSRRRCRVETVVAAQGETLDG